MSNHDHHDMARLSELAASDPEGSEARAMVEECPQCAEEFQLQLEAITSLGELSPASLSERERTRVRQGVWKSLHEEVEIPAPVSEPTPLRPSRPWYTRLVGAAAALVVLAGLGYFLVDNPLIDGDGDSAVQEAAEDTEAAAETTSAAAEADEEAAQATTVTAGDDTAADSAGEREGDITITEEMAETTAAAAATTAPPSEAPALSSDSFSVSDVLDPATADAVMEVVEDLRVTASDRAAPNPGSLNLSQREERCLETLDLDQVLAVDSITVAQRRFMVVSHRVGDATEVEVFYLPRCAEVSLP